MVGFELQALCANLVLLQNFLSLIQFLWVCSVLSMSRGSWRYGLKVCGPLYGFATSELLPFFSVCHCLVLLFLTGDNYKSFKDPLITQIRKSANFYMCILFTTCSMWSALHPRLKAMKDGNIIMEQTTTLSKCVFNMRLCSVHPSVPSDNWFLYYIQVLQRFSAEESIC